MTSESNSWNERYRTGQTGWDIGYSNRALTDYVLKRFQDKSTRILIPGAGRAYEAEFLYAEGYANVYVTDIAPLAKLEFMERVKDFPEDQYIVGDFFELNMSFDLILEQTFFCALPPSLRTDYIRKMHDLLKDGGRLAGVLFNYERPNGPPWGGSREEYEGLFRPLFDILIMENCDRSIPPREGGEFFIEMAKKA